MAEIRTIYFDIGGVLLTNGWDESERARVLARFGVERAEFEARHHAASEQWERGRMTAQQYFEATLFYEPRAFTLEAVWAAVEAESKVLNPGCFELLKRLKAAGYRLATLNNESRELNDYRVEAFGLREWFDAFVCSAYVGEMKPQAGIYRTALEVLQARGEESVFIDDRAANLEPARAMGMNGIQLLSAEQVTAELKALGVRV